MHRHLLRNLALAFVFCCTALGMLSHAVADTNSYTYVWNGSAWVPVSSSNPIPINGSITSTTPAPAPTVSPGLVNGAVVIGPSTAPAAINGAYTVVVDSNGRIATRICDTATSTQCVVVSAGGVLSVTTPPPGVNATIVAPTAAPTAAAFNPAAGVTTNSILYGYNGTTWDPLKSNTGVLATSLCASGNAAQCLSMYNGNLLSTFNSASFPNIIFVQSASSYFTSGSTWNAMTGDSFTPGALFTTTGGRLTASAPSNATTVIKASAGRLARLLITTLGAGTFICYDNASTGSGTIIGDYGASAAVGTIEALDMPAANGITCVSSATGPVVTVSYY